MATKRRAAPAKAAGGAAAVKRQAPAKAGAAKGGTAGTVTLRQMAAGIAEGHELPKRQVQAMFDEFVETLAGHLKDGTKIRIGGLGIFQVRERPARMGRNPATGEQIQIKASKKIAFRPAKELKDSI
jgi:DNA-binding protein HU-beta